MTILYSRNSQRPEPLPFRITLPDGFTRTDPSTFTEAEIVAAGFSGPYSEPPYDPTKQSLDWIDGAYMVRDLPPPEPTPDWTKFGIELITHEVVAPWYNSLPLGLANGLSLGLRDASSGDPRLFVGVWSRIEAPQAIVAAIAELAVACRLPGDFVAMLGSERANPPAAEFIGQEWIAPDGTPWRVVQARNAESGQFIADDPITPERESLQWQPAPTE